MSRNKHMISGSIIDELQDGFSIRQILDLAGEQIEHDLFISSCRKHLNMNAEVDPVNKDKVKEFEDALWILAQVYIRGVVK